MSSKLTLSIDKKVIDRAKRFAKLSNRSLSELVESYLEKITDYEFTETDPELDAVFGAVCLPSNFDERKAYREAVINKNSQ